MNTAYLIERKHSQLTVSGKGARLSKSHELTRPERQELFKRLSVLSNGLQPMQQTEAKQRYSYLRLVLAAEKLTAEEAKLMLAEAADVLGKYPRWAFDQVLDEYRHGRLGDGKFVPKIAELAIEIRKRIEPFQTEKARIEQILHAQVQEERIEYSEEHRSMMLKKFEDLSAELRRA